VPKVLVVDDNSELLALLSSSLEDAGYVVMTAQRGRAALDLVKKDKPDVAIVDILLPDVMGFEVGQALRRASIPFVFMSGVHKGGKASTNAIGQYGAAGYFEKPFERKALLALLEKLAPHEAPKQLASEAWDVEEAEGIDGPSDEMELTGRIDLTSGSTSASITGESLKLSAQQLAQPLPGQSPSAIDRLQIRRTAGPEKIAPPKMERVSYAPPVSYVQATSLPPTPMPEALRAAVASSSGRKPASSDSLANIAAALGVERVPAQSWARPPTRPELSTPPPPPPPPVIRPVVTPAGAPASSPLLSTPPPPPAAALAEPPPPVKTPPPPTPGLLQSLPTERGSIHRGELKDNLPQLFAAFLQAQETGELGMQRGQVKKIVYFEKGMPVFALSNLVADRLGQFLVRAGRIDEETLRSAAQEAQDTKQRTGDVLILMGLITEQERLYYVGQQIKSILYSLFAWEDGFFQLSFQERARKETIKLDIHPATLVMRGVKKLYKPERLTRLLSQDHKPIPSQDPLFSLSDVELQGWEAHVIARCDGTRTVRDLVALAVKGGKTEAEAFSTLVGLVSLRILEVRG
jgi:DNA-binding response OmpR family regulator